MELSQLRYFVLIAELQNLSKAAERLNISQPSLSKSISRLEKELGAPLFERAGKKIILNERGKVFLAGVQEALRGLEDISAVVGSFGTEHRVKLNLGIFWSPSLLIRCLKEFSRLYPYVDFNINCNIESIDHLDTDFFDMMLYPLDADPLFKKYKGHVIARERFRLAVRKDHLLAGQNLIDIGELQEEPFVFIQHSQRRMEAPYHLCLANGFKPKVRFTTSSSDSHRQIIAAGLAVGFVAEGNADLYNTDPNLTLLDIKGDHFRQTVMIGFKREKHLSDTAKLFRDFVMAHFKIPTA